MKANSVDSLIFGLKMMRERPDYTAFAKSFSKPTLIIGGEDDKMCSEEDLRIAHQTFTDSQLEIIAATGHLTPMEGVIEFNKTVYEFIRDRTESDY